MKTPRKPAKRPTNAALLIINEDAMVGVLNRFVAAQIYLTHLLAEHEKTVTDLNAGFEARPDVQRLREEIAACGASIQLFAEDHRDELFPQKKSKDYANATIGFREGQPKFSKRLTKDSEEAIALRMVEIETLAQYVEFEPVIDKKGLILHRTEIPEADLKRAGIEITQGESFYIDPRPESAARIAAPTQAAA